MNVVKIINIFFIICFLWSLKVVAVPTGVERDSKSLYPFSSHPKLSWNKFEQKFREKYSEIDIPPIKVEKNEESSLFYRISTKTIHISPDRCINPASVAWGLLHEAGHHNYSKNKRMHDETCADIGVIGGMLASSVPLARNIYSALKKKSMVSTHKWVKSGAIMGIGLMFNIRIMRPYLMDQKEEKAADAFANKYASKQVLKAKCLEWSCGNMIKNETAEINAIIDKNIKESESLTNQDKKRMETVRNLTIWMNSMFTSVCYNSKLLSIFRDPSHPPYKSRCAAMTQALKDRFGISSEVQ